MVAIIVPGNTWLFPYLGIFKTALERTGMDYEVVCWNREGLEENVAVSYSKPLPLNCSMPAKITGYAAYARYLEKTVSSRKYDKLIFLTPLVALFMRNFLRKHYYKRFWLDYRDMSWELKIKPWFDSLAGMAGGISVSSPAYRDLMPQSSVLCHNLDLDRLERALGENSPMKQASDKIVVSNIGYIRYPDFFRTCRLYSFYKVLVLAEAMAGVGRYMIRTFRTYKQMVGTEDVKQPVATGLLFLQ